MLELLVLGIIPGTSIVITLPWVLLAFLILNLVILANYELKKTHSNHIYRDIYRRIAQ